GSRAAPSARPSTPGRGRRRRTRRAGVPRRRAGPPSRGRRAAPRNTDRSEERDAQPQRREDVVLHLLLAIRPELEPAHVIADLGAQRDRAEPDVQAGAAVQREVGLRFREDVLRARAQLRDLEVVALDAGAGQEVRLDHQQPRQRAEHEVARDREQLRAGLAAGLVDAGGRDLRVRRVVEARAEPERRERHAELDAEADAQPALEIRLDRLRAFPHLAEAAAGHEHTRARHHLDPLRGCPGRAGDQKGHSGENGFRHRTHASVSSGCSSRGERRPSSLGKPPPLGSRPWGEEGWTGRESCKPWASPARRRPAAYSRSIRIPPPGRTSPRQPGGSQVVALYSVTMAGPRSRCPARRLGRPKRGTRNVSPWRTTSPNASGRGSGAGAGGRRGSGTAGPGAVASTRSVTASTGAARRAKP